MNRLELLIMKTLNLALFILTNLGVVTRAAVVLLPAIWLHLRTSLTQLVNAKSLSEEK